jgi:hypothetical protein
MQCGAKDFTDMKIRISSDLGQETKITDEEGQPIGKIYAFRLEGKVGELNTATLFAYAETVDILAEADVIDVPISLKNRAVKMLEEADDPKITAFVGELFGSRLLGRAPEQ